MRTKVLIAYSILPKNRLLGDFLNSLAAQSGAYYNNGELGVYGNDEGKIGGD